MKIFVIHYSKLIERKEYIINHFKKRGIEEYEFVENLNKEDLTPEDYNKFTNDLKPSSISLILKTFWVYKEIAEKYENALIFEDDVILLQGFLEKLDIYMKQLPSDWDMIFLGDGCNLHIPQDQLVPNVYVYKKGHDKTKWGGFGCTRCTDSCLVSNKGAKKIVNYLKETQDTKINLPIDHYLNIMARECQLNVYWTEPTIVTQGSGTGLFENSYDR